MKKEVTKCKDSKSNDEIAKKKTVDTGNEFLGLLDKISINLIFILFISSLTWKGMEFRFGKKTKKKHNLDDLQNIIHESCYPSVYHLFLLVLFNIISFGSK